MNSNFKQQAPLANQAQMLANKGRYGDSMLVHMNPFEVDVLKSMTPNNQLTVNPDTGQPEAFLPILLGLAGALGGGAGVFGTSALLGAVGAGAIGSGIGTAIETGSLEQGLKAGLISGLVGGVGGQIMGSLGGGGSSALGTGAGTGAAGVTNAAGQTLAQAVTPQLPGSILATGGDAATKAVTQTFMDEATKAAATNVGTSLAGTGVAASNPYLYVPPAAPVSQAITAAEQSQLVNALADPADITASSLGARLNSGFNEVLTNENVLSSAAKGGVAGLTGQGLTDDMNVGTSEYDYFSNPFSFTQELKNGGLIRAFGEGGMTGEGGMPGGADMYNPDSPNFDPSMIPANYLMPKFDVPSYFSNPFGAGSSGTQTSTASTSNADQVGNDLDDMIQDSFTRQVYNPRTAGALAGIRGASDIDNMDYNQRLLGDATKEISFMRPMNETELTARSDAQAAEQAASLAAQPEMAVDAQAANDPFGNNFDYSSYFNLDMPADDFGIPNQTSIGNQQPYNPQDYFNFGNIGFGGGMRLSHLMQ